MFQSYEGFLTRAYSAVERITPSNSVYRRRADAIRSREYPYEREAEDLAQILQALRVDIAGGYVQKIEQLVHGEMFDDFLEMASHLSETGYKDAAAVITGSALETHLRHLAKAAKISIEITSSRGIEPKKADAINADLVKAAFIRSSTKKALPLGLISETRQPTGDTKTIKKNKFN